MGKLNFTRSNIFPELKIKSSLNGEDIILSFSLKEGNKILMQVSNNDIYALNIDDLEGVLRMLRILNGN